MLFWMDSPLSPSSFPLQIHLPRMSCVYQFEWSSSLRHDWTRWTRGAQGSRVRRCLVHKKCFVQAVANYSTTSSLLMPSNPTAFSLVTLQSSCFEGIAKFAADEVKVVPGLLAPRLCLLVWSDYMSKPFALFLQLYPPCSAGQKTCALIFSLLGPGQALWACPASTRYSTSIEFIFDWFELEKTQVFGPHSTLTVTILFCWKDCRCFLRHPSLLPQLKNAKKKFRQQNLPALYPVAQSKWRCHQLMLRKLPLCYPQARKCALRKSKPKRYIGPWALYFIRCVWTSSND